MNAGFLEALKLDSDLDCFVFADVDLIPIHLCNIYECSQQPRHLAVNIDTFNYTYEMKIHASFTKSAIFKNALWNTCMLCCFRLKYPMLVGGSLALNEDVMRKLNGFTNIMFGWGGEDDNFCIRFVCLYKSVQKQLRDIW